jgi:hypothetical protein
VNDSALSLDDAVVAASTGDVWLFRGRSLSDRAIQTVTNSPVNHVGMVVALDDLPPLLWHAELGRSLPDVWTGERHRGVQLHRLEEAVGTPRELVRPGRVLERRPDRARRAVQARGRDRGAPITRVPQLVGMRKGVEWP